MMESAIQVKYQVEITAGASTTCGRNVFEKQGVAE
jgi:hypothetical protein